CGGRDRHLERGPDRFDVVGVHPSEEHERQVQVLAGHPAEAGDRHPPGRRRDLDRGAAVGGELDAREQPDLRPVAHPGRDVPGNGAPSRWRRTRSSPACWAQRRTRSRSPRETNPRACVNPLTSAIATQIVPGAAPSWGSGPAAPVSESATPAPYRSRAPVAIASAHASVTVPAASTSSGTPSTRRFASAVYTTAEPTNDADAPGTAVRRSPTPPPVSDSAHASVRFVEPSSRRTACSSDPSSALNTTSPSRARTS